MFNTLSSSPMLTSVTFSGNSAGTDGGGLCNSHNSDLRLTDITFSGNSAGGDGGGMRDYDSSPMLTSVTFSGNSARGDGGGMYNYDSSPTLIGVTFSGNVADQNGGGLYLYASEATLVNNVVAGNQAGTSGGGLYADKGSTARLLHTTLAGNHGRNGIEVSFDGVGAGSTIALTNTILVSHTLGISVAAGCTATLESTLWYGNGSDWAGAGTISHTHDYGGPPAFVDVDAGDYHLRPGSTALDQGVETGLISDIDHQPRPYLAPDLGADEYWPPGALKHGYLPLVLRGSP
jgi:parallel beta-helix repeat protein